MYVMKNSDLTKIEKGKMTYTKFRNPKGVVFEVVTHPKYGIKTSLTPNKCITESMDLVLELIEQVVSIEEFIKEANFVIETQAEQLI